MSGGAPSGPLDLEPIKRRLALAWPGPWGRKRADDGAIITTLDGYEVVRTGYEGDGGVTGWQNADLIAHAPTDLDELVAEVERQDGIISVMYELLKEAHNLNERSADPAGPLQQAVEFMDRNPR